MVFQQITGTIIARLIFPLFMILASAHLVLVTLLQYFLHSVRLHDDLYFISNLKLVYQIHQFTMHFLPRLQIGPFIIR